MATIAAAGLGMMMCSSSVAALMMGGSDETPAAGTGAGAGAGGDDTTSTPEYIVYDEDMTYPESGHVELGEAASIEACRDLAKSKFYKILSFVNVKNSSISRESDSVIYSHAGQEIGVASTKNYVAQLMCLYLFTIYLGLLKWTISEDDASAMIQELKCIPDYIERILEQSETLKKLAKVLVLFAHRD